MKAPKEVPGNVVASAVAFQTHLMKIGQHVQDIDRLVWEATDKRPVVYAINLKCDPDDEQGVLAILRGYKPDGYVVSFHREDTVWECLVGVSKRLANNSLKWKEDEYASKTS
jgi:hypothetical protein